MRSIAPTPSPLPGGPLSRFILDPGRYGRGLLHGVLDLARDAMPWLIGAALIVVALLLAWHLSGSRRRRGQGGGARRIKILPPPEVDPEGARLLWMGMHALLRPWWRRVLLGQPHLAWEITAAQEDVEVSLWVPAEVPPGLVERAVEVAFPGARTEVAEADAVPQLLKDQCEITELALAEKEWFPIGGSQDHDPLGLALASIGGLEEGERAVIQVLARPATSAARYKLRRAARVLRGGGTPGAISWRVGRGRKAGYRPAPDPSVELDVRGILAKASSPLWHCLVRVAVASPQREQARGRIHGLAGAYALFEGRNGFRRRRARGGIAPLVGRTLSRPYLLSVPELAQLATLPAAGAIPGLERAGARTVAPPKALLPVGRVLGVADHAGVRREVALAVEDCRYHVHIVGETGTGKSTLLANLVLQDAEAGRAAVVIDPKGDLIEAILQRLPAGAEERTCVIDPEERKRAVGLNLLAGEDADLVVDHVVGVFKRIYEPWWGPRTDDIMRAACLTLAQIPGATLAEIPLLLSSFEWRQRIRERLEDVVGLEAFWKWYEKLPEQQRAQHIAPLLNKLRAFLLRGPVRAIVGQADPKRDIETLIDNGGLLLVRVPKGTLGEDTSRLLGAFVIARVWQACMKRASMPEEQRPDVTLYVDETHNYLALPRSFEDLLAEARGYRLSLVLAHQHMGQLPKDMRDALGANARTKIVFACSPEDGQILEKHFAPELDGYDLSRLAAYQAACRATIAGGHASAFTFRTKAPEAGSTDRAQQVRDRSAELFASDRAEVERIINRRHLGAADTLLPPEKRNNDNEQSSEAPIDASVEGSVAASPHPEPASADPAGQNA
ncbi:MAG: type IV secretion system DNA-binding domain-containing protein [Actinomycetota bacterium]